MMNRISAPPQSPSTFNLLVALAIIAIFTAMGFYTSADYQQQTVCYEGMSNETVALMRGIPVTTVTKLKQGGRAATNHEICIMPKRMLKRAVMKVDHPKPDNPGEAIAFRLSQLKNEKGVIPSNALKKADLQIELMRSTQSLSGANVTAPDWEWVGPGNIGGRVRSIVINPDNPDIMFAGSVSGGIWRSDNAGISWSPVDDFMASLAVSTLVIDPGNPDTLYAGTGEGFFNADGIRGAGIFKSTDGGITWLQLSATNNSDFTYVNRLSISPVDSNIILAATRNSGIWRSTDAGVSWSQVLSFFGAADVDFQPGSGAYAIASGYYGGTYFSSDSGITWNTAGNMPSRSWVERVEVAYSPSNPNIAYASVNTNGGLIYRSTNGGASYTLVNAGNSNQLGNQGWYGNALWVDPTNENIIIVGGLDLWRSTNAGSSLTKISQWWSAPASAHADHHFVVAHPGFNGSTNKTVYFGNDGGVYRTDNVYTVIGTNGWQELNNNLGITQFYGAAGNATSGVIIGGTQDNGTLQYTGGTETWDAMFGGDGGWCAADPDDPNYFYGEYVYLRIHRSTNGGTSSNYIYSGLADAENDRANFIAPFILDPNDSNTLLAGGQSLWRSNNVKAATPFWSDIKSPNSGSSNISAITVAKGNSDVIWVGHNNGDIYKTTNGTAASPTWNQVNSGLPHRTVMRIAVDKNDHNNVYATFSGFSSDNIWRSTDGGSTWGAANGLGGTQLPSAPIRSVVFHPNNSNWLYVGTEVGIFTSEDSGDNWFLSNNGPANVSVDDLFWLNDDTLVAATHGRGLYKATIPIDTLDQPTLLAPSGIISNTTPTFSWNPIAAATDYQITINTGNGNPVSLWYTATESGCVDGTSTCSINSPSPITASGATWWIKARNASGEGPLSEPETFSFPYLLKNDTWQMFSIPYDAGANNTVQDILGGLLGVSDYQSKWAVFKYLPNSGYQNLSLTDALIPGEGYWIIQITGSAVQLSLPADSTSPAVTPRTNISDGCQGTNGCYESPQVSGSGYTWNITGFPTPQPVVLGNLGVKTQGGSCASGCSLSDATVLNYLHNTVWIMTETGYQVIDEAGILNPWDAAWTVALPGADGLAMTILTPADADLVQ